MATKQITDASFEADVLSADGPVLVDFWAEWCGPCKMIGPSLEEISEELGDRVTITKINIDENPEIAGQLGIRGIPTLHIYRGGQKVSEQIGIANVSTKRKMREWIEGELA